MLSTARPPLRDDPARACLVALCLANVVLVWSLPLLVGQDLPQHLTYARILADYADPGLPFRDHYVLPAHAQPYFTAYLLLAPLTRLSSVLTACRVLYTGYVVAMAAGFTSLVVAVHAKNDGAARATPWTCLFGALLPWNPVQCVGFLPFMLSLPAILFAAAALVRTAETGARRGYVALGLAAAATASLHMVAGASLVGFACLYAVARSTRRAFALAALTAAATAGTLGAWHALGERGLAEFPTDALVAGVRSMGLYDGVVRVLGVQWTSLATKGAFLVATVLGPLTREAKAVVGVLLVSLVTVTVSARRQQTARTASPARLAYGLATLTFALLVVVTPASICLPDDICLLDFRLYVVAFMLALAFLDPRWFEPARARVALTVFGSLVLVVWSHQLAGVANEANAVVHLTDSLAPTDRVLALPFHDRSAYLDEDNSVTHYFPMYYTALRGGMTSLFWGKFSHHLPVGYREGHAPDRPPDWDPALFTRAQLLAVTHVLVEWPDAEDGERAAYGALRLRSELSAGFTPDGCEGRWCLYASPTAGSSVAERERRVRDTCTFSVTDGERARR